MITFIQYLVGPPRASIHAVTRALMLWTNVRVLACASLSHSSCKNCRTMSLLHAGVVHLVPCQEPCPCQHCWAVPSWSRTYGIMTIVQPQLLKNHLCISCYSQIAKQLNGKQNTHTHTTGRGINNKALCVCEFAIFSAWPHPSSQHCIFVSFAPIHLKFGMNVHKLMVVSIFN